MRQMDFLALLMAGNDINDFFRETLALAVADLSPLAALLLAALIFRPLRCTGICVASKVDELRVLEAVDVDKLSTRAAFSVEMRALAAGL